MEEEGGGGTEEDEEEEEWEESGRSNIHQRQPSTFQTAPQIRRRGRAFSGQKSCESGRKIDAVLMKERKRRKMGKRWAAID